MRPQRGLDGCSGLAILSRMSRSSLLSLGLFVVVVGGGCFDDPAPSGDETESSASTESTGDGDGDPATGDGDGDVTTSGDGDGDPTTSGDGDGDATGDGDGDATGDGDGDETTTGDGDGDEDLCGNGVLDAGEICDDGSNLGVEEGECAPDCSTVVQVRVLRVSAEGHAGDLESLPGQGDLPERVDSLCPLNYKALFTYGGARNATDAPFAGDGQFDWVLRPWTRYERQDGTWIGTTDAAALLGVRDGAWVGLENPIAVGGFPVIVPSVFTGMGPDYRTLTDPDEVCAGYTVTQGGGWRGNAELGDLEQGKNFLYNSNLGCAVGHVMCAQQ